MEQLRKLTAVAVPIMASNVDTDQIFPSRFTGLGRENGAFKNFLFHDQRFDDKEQLTKIFPLDDPRFPGAQIIVAADNYGCGSARPGAIHAHVDFGIRVVIAESFGPVFASVAYKSGLLTLQLDPKSVKELREALLAAPGSAMSVDLEEQVVTGADGSRYTFEVDPFVKKVLLDGLSEVELTLGLSEAFRNFEEPHKELFPWLYDSLFNRAQI